jgi:4-amino-4-deoxy-L-arabinose transferase-like glycosyltransferase
MPEITLHPLPIRSTEKPCYERWWSLALVVIFLLLAFHFARGLQRPWSEEDNWYGAVYSQAAHNNLRGGLHAGGVPATLYFGPLPIPPDAYYVHHPTLLPTLVTVSFAALGEAEWTARLIPVLTSLASLVVLWFLVREAAGPRAATLAAAVFAAVPMELHYGDMVDFEPVLTFWMLGLLSCVWHWEKTGRRRWATAASGFAVLALWTDWPGYLLVIGVSAWFVFAAPRGRRWFGWLLGGLVGLAGLLFLWQIHTANAAAWSDLWNALQMRLGNAIPTSTAPIANDAPRFTWGDWLHTVGGDLRDNYLTLTWVFVAIGTIRLLRERRVDGDVRWLGWAAAQMLVAGTLYVVLLRNESFIHDFAPFYIIGAVAMLAGLGLDAACRGADALPQAARLIAFGVVAAVVIALAVLGFRQSEEMRSPYLILDGKTAESSGLIPSLGRVLDKSFPPGATILANFDPYGSALTYYARRPILTNLLTPDDWRAAITAEHPAGGVIWLRAPGAEEILAALPGHHLRYDIVGVSFAFWQPGD